MTLGLATITGIFARWFSSMLTAMLTFFLGLGIWGYATGKHPDCGCFGSGGRGSGLASRSRVVQRTRRDAGARPCRDDQLLHGETQTRAGFPDEAGIDPA